jgi:hypothetical protein
MSAFPPAPIIPAQPSDLSKKRRVGRQALTIFAAIPLMLMLVLAGGGCSNDTTTSANNSSAGPKGPPSLTATPNPVPAGTDKGKTTIAWSTGNGSLGQVYVSDNSKPESLFATGSKGSKEAPWIQGGHTYDFRLYAGSEHTQVLLNVTVTRSK